MLYLFTLLAADPGAGPVPKKLKRDGECPSNIIFWYIMEGQLRYLGADCHESVAFSSNDVNFKEEVMRNGYLNKRSTGQRCSEGLQVKGST